MGNFSRFALAILFLSGCLLSAWLVHSKPERNVVVENLGGLGAPRDVRKTEHLAKIPAVTKYRPSQRDSADAVQEFNDNHSEPLSDNDANFGHFGTKAKLERFMVDLCTMSARVGNSPSEYLDAWVRDRTYWEHNGELYERAPLILFTQDSVPSDVSERIDVAESSYREQLIQVAEESFTEFGLAAEEYVSRGVPQVSREEEYDRFGMHFQREVGHITVFSTVTAGAWKYVIDFNSTDFPELEVKMVRIAELKAERKRHVIQILNEAGLLNEM